MANTFKVKTHPAMPASAGTFDTLYTCGASNGSVVLGLILCNVDSSQRTVDVKLVSNTDDTELNADVLLLKDVPIPAGSSLEVLSGGKVVIQNTDVIQIDSDITAKIDATLSIMEMT